MAENGWNLVNTEIFRAACCLVKFDPSFWPCTFYCQFSSSVTTSWDVSKIAHEYRSTPISSEDKMKTILYKIPQKTILYKIILGEKREGTTIVVNSWTTIVNCSPGSCSLDNGLPDQDMIYPLPTIDHLTVSYPHKIFWGISKNNRFCLWSQVCTGWRRKGWNWWPVRYCFWGRTWYSKFVINGSVGDSTVAMWQNLDIPYNSENKSMGLYLSGRFFSCHFLWIYLISE